MLLAIDIGNTHVVFGLYREEELLGSWRLQSDTKRAADEFALQMLALLQHEGYRADEVNSVIISCVVPSLARVFSKVSQKYFSVEPHLVGPGIKTGMKISVDNPRAVGADRIVNAVAAIELVGAPSIIVDFGTATTFDVISSEPAYTGGVIAPGVIISAEALFDKAALLPSIEFAKPRQIIGKNTRDSMLAGMYYGYVSLVDGIIERILEEVEGNPKIVATGGLARTISGESRYITKVIPELTLQGLQIIAARNK